MNHSVANMTVGELRQPVRSVVREALDEVLADPDAGLELQAAVREQLAAELDRLQAGDLETKAASLVTAELGLRW